MKQLVLAFAAAVLFSGASFGGEKMTIGFSQCILDSPFYVSLMDAAVDAAKERGVDFIYLDAQSNIQKQNNDIYDLVARGVDALIVNPVDPAGVTPAIERAKEAGIPIIAVDRPVNEEINAFIGRDNRKMGRVVGDKAVELLGGQGKAKGKILELQGDAGGSVMMARRDGFHDAVDKEAGITVVQSPYCEYVRANAVKATQDLLQAHPDIALVYGHNDDMALGGLQVLEQAGRAEGLFVLGVDGLMEAVEAITAGRYHGTAMNDPNDLGKLAVEAAIRLAEKKPQDANVDAGTRLIDASNAKQFYNTQDTFATMK